MIAGARRAFLALVVLTLQLSTAPRAVEPAEPPGRPSRPDDAHRHDLHLERRIALRVSRAEALSRVRALVGLGPRMGGTASNHRAADSLSGTFASLGLSVRVLHDPPIPTHEELSWEVRLGSSVLPSAWPYGFSPSAAAVDAPIVPDRASGPKGEAPTPAPRIRRAVVLTSSPAHEVYAAAVAAGALAILTDHPADPSRFPDAAPVRQLAARPGESSPIPVFGISWRDGARVREALGSPEAPRVTFRLDARQGVGAPHTVEATLAGAGSRRDELVLMCAHGDSDSGGPGADDNASGVAALVEVARALAWAAAENLLPADRPTVRFIVWGAELDSSRSYVASRREELRRVAAVINYDQAGTGAERDALYIEGNDIPFNAPLLRLMERVASDHAGAEGFWREWTTTPALGGTDTDAFLPREHGGHGAVAAPIPATTVFTSAWDAPVRRPQTPGWRSPGWSEPGDLFIDFSAWYHSSGDTPERTTEAEPFNMERCARLAVITILRLMGAPPPERAATRSGRSRRCAWSPSAAGG